MELTVTLALGVPLSALMAQLFIWERRSAALPTAPYRLSEAGSGCRVELDYLRLGADRGRLLWE